MSPVPPPPQRLLMGPGPSDVPPRVLSALAWPTVGHLDPAYLAIMDECRTLLQQVFLTANRLTLAIPGTGSAGMEAVLANLLEPGDEAIIGVNGVFGGRMKDVAERCGAVVHSVEAPWGHVIEPDAIAAALRQHPKAKLVAVVHAETSTGAHTPVGAIGRLVRQTPALFVVDAVTSLAGMELKVDEWQIDACYSGSQKCLSCPPGLAPVTFGPRALAAMDRRRGKCQSWYLDMAMIRNYWGQDRVYHHTAPVNMTYALLEALRLVVEEGLTARIGRHLLHHRALRAGFEAMGLVYVPDHSLTTLNAVHIPVGVDDLLVRRRLLQEFGIEIGGGLGVFKGKAWRIGLMGASSSRRHVTTLLAALETILLEVGAPVPRGQALVAASEVYRSHSAGN